VSRCAASAAQCEGLDTSPVSLPARWKARSHCHYAWFALCYRGRLIRSEVCR